MIKIDKGIPVPPVAKYPWKDMAVGDSFIIYSIKPKAAGSNVTQANQRNPGKRFIQRRDGSGIRVWRIE